jgi:hypothetical protein
VFARRDAHTAHLCWLWGGPFLCALEAFYIFSWGNLTQYLSCSIFFLGLFQLYWFRLFDFPLIEMTMEGCQWLINAEKLKVRWNTITRFDFDVVQDQITIQLNCYPYLIEIRHVTTKYINMLDLLTFYQECQQQLQQPQVQVQGHVEVQGHDVGQEWQLELIKIKEKWKMIYRACYLTPLIVAAVAIVWNFVLMICNYWVLPTIGQETWIPTVMWVFSLIVGLLTLLNMTRNAQHIDITLRNALGPVINPQAVNENNLLWLIPKIATKWPHWMWFVCVYGFLCLLFVIGPLSVIFGCIDYSNVSSTVLIILIFLMVMSIICFPLLGGIFVVNVGYVTPQALEVPSYARKIRVQNDIIFIGRLLPTLNAFIMYDLAVLMLFLVSRLS